MGVFVTIKTAIETGAVVDGDTVLCYVSAEDAAWLETGMTVSVENNIGSVKSISAVPVQVDDGFDDYILYLTGFIKGDFCYAAEVESSGMTDGIYAALITVDSTHPISFVIHY